MTKTKKTTSSKKASTAAPAKAPAKARSETKAAPRRARTAAVVLADTAPAHGAPTPPTGFIAPTKKRPGGSLPNLQQVRDAGDVAKEVLAESYWDDFGNRAPDPQQLSAALALAKAWSNELAATESWQTYVRAQYDLAWNAVTPLINVLTPEFRLAAKSNAGIAKKYPQTGDFLNVRKVSAKKAAATRARRKKAAAKKAQKPSGS